MNPPILGDNPPVQHINKSRAKYRFCSGMYLEDFGGGIDLSSGKSQQKKGEIDQHPTLIYIQVEIWTKKEVFWKSSSNLFKLWDIQKYQNFLDIDFELEYFGIFGLQFLHLRNIRLISAP